MNSVFIRKLFNYSIFSLAVFLIFVLVFEPFLEFPRLVSWIGHFHPVILHFPIVLILIAIVQSWRKDPYAEWYIASTALLTLLSAITGFILSLEGGTKGNLILLHQWLGVTVALAVVFWYYWQSRLSKNFGGVLHGVLAALIVLTGHYGGMVTHGKDFLSFSENANAESKVLPEDPNVYKDIVQPIFDNKCVACHNPNKSKGGLVLTDFASLSKGGESGSVFDRERGLIHRLGLPIDHEDHMPPADEDQLNDDELEIIKGWFKRGAREDLFYSQIGSDEPSFGIIGQMIAQSDLKAWNKLPEISNDKIEDLTSEYCTIRRLYHKSNALQVLVFPHGDFGMKDLKHLDPIAKNIVELKLSNLPIGVQEMNYIGRFENIEWLDLSNSSIGNASLASLQKLGNLEKLKVYNTQLDDGALAHLSRLDRLSELYIYGTNFTEQGIEQLKNAGPGLSVIDYAIEALQFKSVLPPPVLDPHRYFFRDPFYVKIEHPLTGINIKYSLDLSDPGNGSSFAKDSFLIDRNYTIKYMATKEGWESSPVDSVRFLRSEIEPARFELENLPDEKYLGTGKSLLFDLEKGSGDFGDDAWMAFKNNAFILNCTLERETTLSEIVLSSLVNTDPYIFPPSTIEIYGGMRSGELSKLNRTVPEVLKERSELHFEYYRCKLRSTPVKYLKIVVKPLDKIPVWHQGKGERGWFFIDEVVLIEKEQA
ncbi:MAG: hypothetical protein MI975_20545 [Cytophagales bacterium]|nr:hypothetical protein [Cytophagales bacterium]